MSETEKLAKSINSGLTFIKGVIGIIGLAFIGLYVLGIVVSVFGL